MLFLGGRCLGKSSSKPRKIFQHAMWLITRGDITNHWHSLTGFKMIFHEFNQTFGGVLYGTINGLGGSSEQESSDKRFSWYLMFDIDVAFSPTCHPAFYISTWHSSWHLQWHSYLTSHLKCYLTFDLAFIWRWCVGEEADEHSRGEGVEDLT